MKEFLGNKLRVRYVAWFVIILLLVAGSVPFFGGSSGVQASECVVGSSSTCPATSPQEIYNLYGTTTNGTYWLRVGGVATEVYVVMDRSASWGSGYWILLMKGTQGSNNFGYNSTYFTSNSSTLNTNSLTNDVSTDAKFSVYNNMPVSQLLAVLRNPANGTIRSQGEIANNSFGGHTWIDTVTSSPATAFTQLTTNRVVNGNQRDNIPNIKYYETSSRTTQVFSYQTGQAQYGFSLTCGDKDTRWGIVWNNESTNLTSCDAYVGIGLESHSPGDWVTYNDSLTFPSVSNAVNGGKRAFAFQIWGKMASPSLSAPSSLSVSTSGLGSVNLSWNSVSGATDYVVQYKTSASSSWTNSFVVTGQNTASISGLTNDTAYNYRVFARTSTNSSSSAATSNHTITTYTLIYSYNGATSGATPSSVEYAVGTSGITLPTPLRTGYTFAGWFEASNFSGSALTSPYSPTATRTIYAKWTANTQTINYNNNTGSGSISNLTGGTDSNVTLSDGSDFEKPGYTLVSWNTQSDGEGTSYPLSDSITMPVGGLSLFAIWTAVSQSITYNANLGTGSIASTDANTDSSVTLSDGTGIERTGYDLIGWNTQSDGSGTSYDLSDSLTMPAGGLSLYAIWQSTLAINTPTDGLSARVDEAFSLNLTSTGGSGGNSFTASTLPAGLSIDSSTGEISGTPTTGGSTSLTVTVTDSSGATKTTSSFTISVAAAILANATTPSAQADNASIDSITVSWTSVNNVSSYTLRIYDSSDNLLDTISNISGTSQQITDLDDSTTYKVSIQAIGDGVSYTTSNESSVISVTTNAPVSVTISAALTNLYSSRQIRYTFTFSENVTGFTAGNITISGTSTGWTKGTLTGSGSSYSIILTSSNPESGSIELELVNTGISSVATEVVGPNASAATFNLARSTQVGRWIKFLWGEELQRF